MIKKITLKFLLLVVSLGLVFSLLFFLSNKIESSKQEASAYLVKWIGENTGWQTEIGEVKLSFPLKISVNFINIKESDQTVLKIENLILSLSPFDALRKHLVFNAIQMDALHLSEKVFASEFPQKSPESLLNLNESEQSASFIPKQFKVAHIQIDWLSLTDSAIWQHYLPIPLSVVGNLAIDLTEKSGLLDLTITSLSDPHNAFHVVTAAAQKIDDIHFQTRLKIADSRSLAHFISIPRDFSLHKFTIQSFIEAEAPLSVWKKVMNRIDLAQEEALHGSFQINYLSEALALKESQWGSYGSLKGNFATSSEKKLAVSEITALVGSNTLEGFLSIDQSNSLDGTYFQLKIREVSFMDKKLPHFYGNLQLNGEVSGSLYTPEVNANLLSSGLKIGDESLENVAATVHVNGDGTHYSGLVSVESDLKQNKIKFSSHFNWDGARALSLTDLQLKAPQTEMQGFFDLEFPDKMVKGELIGKTDLALFQFLSDQKIVGELSFKAHLKDQNEEEPNAALHLMFETQHIQIGDLALQDASLNVDGNLFTQEGTLKISSKKIIWDKREVFNISSETTIDRKNSEWPFKLSLGKDSDPMRVLADGHWSYIQKEFSVGVNQLKGALADHQFALQDPFTFRKSLDGFSLSPVLCSLDQGTIRTRLKHSSLGSQGKFEAENLPLDMLYFFNSDLPLLSGTFSCAAFISETPTEVKGDLSLKINRFKFLVEPLETPEDMDGIFTAELSDHQLTCQGHVTGLGPDPIAIQAHFPVTVALSSPAFELHQDQEFSTHLELRGPIGAFLELVMTGNVMNINGQTTLSLDANGTLASPKIKGRGEIFDGYFELVDLGTSLKNVTASFELNDRTMTLNDFSAHDGITGIVTGTGTAELDPAKKFPFDLQLELSKAAVLKMDYLVASASGKLRFEGNAEKALLKGALVTDSVVITFPDQVNDLAEAMDITYINQVETAVKPTEYVKAKAGWPLGLDLDIQMPGKGLINGTNLNSEWKGNVLLTGSSDLPLFNGSCQIIRGEYNIQGKIFQINEGSIIFAGDIEKKTTFYVIASKEIQDIKADIIVKGNLKSPAISFRSNPPLPQREILSWILFNQGSSGITAFQGTQLNESITNLPSGSSEPDILTKIRNRIGIDRIDITRNDSGGDSNEVSVQVGKYLSKGIFVSVNKSVTAEANRLAIEANLIKNFKVQAEVGDDSDAQLLLKWKHDY